MGRSKSKMIFSAGTLFFFGIALVIVVATIGCSALPLSRPVQATPSLIPLPTLDNSNPPLESATMPPTPTTPPTAIPVVSPTLEPTIAVQVVPTNASTPTPVPTLSGATMQVKIFLIATGDNGISGPKIGCGDSVVGVQRVIPATKAPLTAALNDLLSLHDQFYGQSGLYNSLYQSKLQLQSVTLVNGVATVNLTGTLMLGGVCDDPRVDAQLTNTALQFSTVHSANIFLNGQPLKQVLSEK